MSCFLIDIIYKNFLENLFCHFSFSFAGDCLKVYLAISLAVVNNVDLAIETKIKSGTKAQWHIDMSSASHREDPGSNPSKG